MQDFMQALREERQPPFHGIEKKGTLDIGIVETTPVVFSGRLFRFEWIRNNKWGNGYYQNTSGHGYYRFVDMQSGEVLPGFAYDHAFGCAVADRDTMVVVGVEGEGGGNRLNVFRSTDLRTWNKCGSLGFAEDWKLYNTSVCPGPDGYVMAIEIGAPAAVAGVPFTCVFAQSQNLTDWTLLDPQRYVYTKQRYSACPVIRFINGFYYMIYLEGLPCHRWVPYIVRSADLLQWELGIRNPVMFFDDDDRKVPHPEQFTAQQLDLIASAVNCNNSDVDLCDFGGKTVILYSWGNQLGKEFLAEAVYEGTMTEFLESFFA